MSIDKVVDKVKVNLSRNTGRAVDYLMKHDLKTYFAENVPEEERQRRKSFLESRVDETSKKYGDELKGIARKGITRGSMGLAVLNDAYAYVSAVPIANVTGLGYALFAAKSIAELPGIYHYMKKSHDWYGALGHYAMKPINYLIPVVGGAIEAGSFERMVMRRVRKESRDDFIREFGHYKTFESRLQEQKKKPLREAVEVPQRIAA